MNPVGKAIREKFMDGKWHSAPVIAREIAAPLEDIRGTLDLMHRRVAKNYKVEKRQRAKDFEYRIFSQNKTVGLEELTEKLGPLIERLKEQGKRNMATISIGTIAEVASRLEALLKEWTQ